MLELIRSIQKQDPAAPSMLQVLLAYAGFHAILAHRIASFLWRCRLRAVPSLVAYLARAVCGIEIHPAAKIGRRVFIDHGMGVVIGETAQVGDDVTIYHGVTLGGKKPSGAQRGAKRHPTLQAKVMVGAGACLLGDIVIGEGAIIGANSVVTSDVPIGARVAGNPAYILKKRSHTASTDGSDGSDGLGSSSENEAERMLGWGI